MAEIYIPEPGSEMVFGPFPEDCVFHLEKSSMYAEEFRRDGAKSCEFILLRDHTLYFVEAKKTCPNCKNTSESDKKQEKYREYITDISQKMSDSLEMFTSILLKCNDTEEIPDRMRLNDLKDYAIRFVLVVKNAEPGWLEPYPAVLQSKLRKEMSIWHVPSFIVWTEERAKKRGLVSNHTHDDVLVTA